jgi:hypothetical protein
MSYSEARSHFENAKNNTLDKTMIDLLDGLKHLTHSVEEDIRTLSLSIRDIHDIQIRKTREGSFSEPIPSKQNQIVLPLKRRQRQRANRSHPLKPGAPFIRALCE